MIVEKLLIFLAIVAVGFGAYKSFEGVLKENGELRTERTNLKQSLSEQSDAYVALVKEKDAADKAAAAARQRAVKAQGDFDAYRNGIRGVLSSDPTARVWSDELVPARVAACLRAGPDCDGTRVDPGNAPGGAARADARARVTATAH